MMTQSSWLDQKPSPEHNADHCNPPTSVSSINRRNSWAQTVQHGTSSLARLIAITPQQFFTMSFVMKNILPSISSRSSEIACASISTTAKN